MVAQLSVATPWSFSWGASSVDDLAQAAAQRGIKALGMCDYGGLWGAVPFQKACLAHGVKPLFGLRLALEGAEAQLLALDESGWAALCRLSSRLQCLSDSRERANPSSNSLRHSRRLAEWLASESASGEFLVFSSQASFLSQLQSLQCGLEIYATCPRVASELGLPFLLAPPVVMADRENLSRHRLLCAIGRNMRVSHLTPDMHAPPEAWLMGEEQLKHLYPGSEQARSLALEIAERAHFLIPLHKKRMPRLSGLPQGRSSDAHLARLCARGWKRRRLPSEKNRDSVRRKRYLRQLHRELDLIRQQKLADYFLLVADIVRWAQQQKIQSIGRGSAANSLVCWLLGLTQIDPLEQGLWFDRFLNEGRKDFPDVDLDFAWDERDRVLAYVQDRWGKESVAMLSTHITFAERGAIREIAKAMGLPPAEITDFQKRRRAAFYQGKEINERIWEDILEKAKAIDGFPRHLGVHPGGLIVAPGRLQDQMPLQYAKKKALGRPLVITQWDMGPVEEAGFLKIDLLGNRGLAVVRDAAQMASASSGLPVQPQRLKPERDSRTQELLARGDTMGCFYIESPSMRSLLRKLDCRDLPTLIAASSIIRPGIASSGMMRIFIERFHETRCKGKQDELWYLHPRLQDLLSETYGVMTYQEDVLRIAQKLAGMSASEADALRKAMSHKRSAERISNWESRFVDGLLESGFGPVAAKELWRQVESFAGYSFCKAHSASYANLSYRSAWLRAHFPAEFMAAVLRNHGGFYDTFAYLAEARRMGLRLKLPCVNSAQEEFCGAAGDLRVGLSEVSALSAHARKKLIQKRPFASLQDMVNRVTFLPSELEALVRSGACDGLADGMTRAERMRWVALWQRRRLGVSSSKRDTVCEEVTLFPQQQIPKPPPVEEFSQLRLWALEEEALGCLVSAHPLEAYVEAIQSVKAVRASHLHQHVNQRIRLVGWQVTQKPLRTRSGKAMGFLSFEDTTALYETVLFPDAWRRLAPWALTRGPYVLEGVPRLEHGDITVEVSSLSLIAGNA